MVDVLIRYEYSVDCNSALALFKQTAKILGNNYCFNILIKKVLLFSQISVLINGFNLTIMLCKFILLITIIKCYIMS